MAKRKRRAVAYVRVSTASSAQLHSYEYQEQYWRGKFIDDPDTELVGIYADRGISGSSIYKRPQFLIMMQDARDGKFDIIYTKSVSRFARNTVQLLEAVRELRDLGIEVIFEKEQISTMQPTSELFLTIAATVAENDLQVDSERQKWSIQHRYENGWISIGSGMFGYRMTKDNNLVIVEEEAAVIRRIYDMYIGGMGCTTIARILNEEGSRTWCGNEWKPTRLLELMANEKYMGDSMMGKSVVVDGVQMDNMDGQHGKRYYMEDTHEGIVSKETWYKAQAIREQRRNDKVAGSKKPVYPFTSMIECGCCGRHYQHKVNNSGKKWRNDIWACATQLRKGVAVCDCTRLKDSVLREQFIAAYNQFVTERPQGNSIEALQSVVAELRKEESDLAELLMQRLIPESAFRTEQRRIKAQIAELTAKINEQRGKIVRESDFTIITEFDPEKVEKFITKVIVRKWTVTFVFYNGIEITKAYTNGPSGNQVGWKQKKEVAAWQ